MPSFKEETIKAISASLKEFGEYHYYDKGPAEVMDIDKIIKELRKFPAPERAEMINSLSEGQDKEMESHINQLVGAILMDTQEDDGWEEVYNLLIPRFQDTF